MRSSVNYGASLARVIPARLLRRRGPRWANHGTRDSHLVPHAPQTRLEPARRVFGPVWTVLYTFMALAAWLLRRGMSSTQSGRTGTTALWLWWLQLTLNLAWSLVFFGRRRPGWGLVVIGVLEVTIIATTLAAACLRLAAALLTPYALWTAFASVLNFRIWRLNPR